MKRIMSIAIILFVISAASRVEAGGGWGIMRWLGVHCGPGIHAHNNCPTCDCHHTGYHRHATRHMPKHQRR